MATTKKTTGHKVPAEFKPIKVSPTKAYPHGPEYELWEYPPAFPHPPGVHGTPFPADEPGDLESQCGATFDTQDVEQYDGTLGVTQAFVASHERPVGQLQWNSNLASIYTDPGNVSGVRWCSGTLISCDLFLTAGHCFDKTGGGWSRPKDNVSGQIIEPSEIATNMHVNFNYQRDPTGVMRTSESFAVTDLVEYRLGGLDFAVARLAGNPGKKYGWTHVATADANNGDMLAIIGHPNGVPKVIEAGPQTDLHGDQVGYNDIDTLGGSSGSGILGPAGTIVGVHTNGGCTTAGIGHNHGVRISSILAASTTVSSVATNPSKFANDGCQSIKIKFSDDLPPYKLAWLDNIGLKRIWTDINPKSLQDKRVDDVKMTAYDWNVFSPAARFINPVSRFGGFTPRGGARQPFILSTPHHSEAMATHESEAEQPEVLEVLAAQVEALHEQLMMLAQGIAELAEGQS